MILTLNFNTNIADTVLSPNLFQIKVYRYNNYRYNKLKKGHAP